MATKKWTLVSQDSMVSEVWSNIYATEENVTVTGNA